MLPLLSCHQARVVRSVCLVDLGAPPEYVTAVKTNASEIGGTVEEVPEATAVAAAGTVAAEEDEVKAGEREESIDRSDGASATEAAPDHDAAAALVSAYSADDVDCTAAPDRSGEAAVSTSDSATEAVPDTAQVAPSTTDEGQLLNIADITIPPVVAGVPVFSEGVPASGLHGEEEKAREQENKKEVKMFVKELATPLAQEDEDYRAGTVDPAYARASREFGRLGGCRTPAEMLVVVGSGTKLLSEDAARISVSPLLATPPRSGHQQRAWCAREPLAVTSTMNRGHLVIDNPRLPKRDTILRLECLLFSSCPN